MTSAGIPDDAILGDSQEMARVLAEATAKAEAQGDDSGSSMSFGEKKDNNFLKTRWRQFSLK